MARLFLDRQDAGRRLALSLARLAGRPGLIVLGLPRGGVPVAYEVAHALGAPLDVYIVRKLGVPGHAEFAFGAVATGGTVVLQDATVRELRISPAVVATVRAREELELRRRERLFRGDRPPVDVHGSTVIIVDDGLATGSTMQAAVTALRSQAPSRIIAAAPVASPSAAEAVSAVADETVFIATPLDCCSVGAWYADFEQTTDDEVHHLLGAALSHLPEDAATAHAYQLAMDHDRLG